MKWYKRDPNRWFTGTRNVLTMEEKGFYADLIEGYIDRDGDLPNDEIVLARLCGCRTNLVRRLLFQLFQKQKLRVNATGNLVPNGVEATMTEAKKFLAAPQEVQQKSNGSRVELEFISTYQGNSSTKSNADAGTSYNLHLHKEEEAHTRPQERQASKKKFYARFGSAELEAWDDYGRITKGTTYPRDKHGGWSFPSQWPPSEEERLDYGKSWQANQTGSENR